MIQILKQYTSYPLGCKIESPSNPCDFEEVTQHTSRVVTNDMNRELIGDFTRAGVELALNQIAPLKALGPDGMPPIFYQHYWQSIGDDVIEAVLSCLNTRKILTGLNHTYLTLISKVKSLVKVSDFQPIALCNILYKIISKVLANKLKKKIMPHLSFKMLFRLIKPS